MRRLALLLCFSWATTVEAADIVLGGDPYMGCDMTLSGVIEKGDATKLDDRFWDFIDAFEFANPDVFDLNEIATGALAGKRLCLDSPGGSFSEALSIGEELSSNGITTAVARDALCHSACAILFLAGKSSEKGAAPFTPGRLLHATASLGFHAPSLVVEGGQYSKAQVEGAYNVAILSLGELVQRKQRWNIPDSLIEVIVTTPPSEMRTVDTVFEAAFWQIAVVGSVYPQQITPLAAANACAMIFAREGQANQRISSMIGLAGQSLFAGDARLSEDGKTWHLKTVGLVAGKKVYYDCALHLPTAEPSASDTASAHGPLDIPPERARIIFEGGPAEGILPAFFFGMQTPLKDIARPHDDALAFMPVAGTVGPYSDFTSKGVCTTWVERALRHREACTLAFNISWTEDLRLDRRERFTNTAGETLEIASMSDAEGVTILGAAGHRLEKDAHPTDAPDTNCWQFDDKRAIFCFSFPPLTLPNVDSSP